MHAFLLIEIVDHRGVFAGESLEALFASRIREAAAIENEPAAISRLIFRQVLVKGKTENPNDQVFGFRSEALQSLRGQHALEGVHQRRKGDGEPDVVKEPAEVLQRVRHALQKMSLALIEAAKAVSAQCLQDADVNIGVVVPHEGLAIYLDKAGKAVQIVIEELLTELGRQVGLGIVQERGDVVLQSAFAAALIIHKKGMAVAQQDVAGLEVAIEKVIARSAQQKFRQSAKIVFKGLFVEGDTGEAEEIIFEVIQIPGDGLAIETGDGIADTVVQITAGFDLKAGQHGNYLAIGFDDLRSNVFAGAVFGKELEKGGIAEVFLEISALVQSFGVNFRNGKAVASKMFGEFQESSVFFAHAVEDADGTGFLVGYPDVFSAGTAEITLQRHEVIRRFMEVLLKKLFENVHSIEFHHSASMNCRD